MAIFNFENPAESLLLPFPLLFVAEVRKKQNRQFAAGAASPCAGHDVHQHFFWHILISSVRSSNSHPDLLLTHHHQHPLFQITPVLNTGLSLSEPLQLYKGYNAI